MIDDVPAWGTPNPTVFVELRQGSEQRTAELAAKHADEKLRTRITGIVEAAERLVAARLEQIAAGKAWPQVLERAPAVTRDDGTYLPRGTPDGTHDEVEACGDRQRAADSEFVAALDALVRITR